MALDSIEQFERAVDTPVEHMLQGAETAIFQIKMQDWHKQCLTFVHTDDWNPKPIEVDTFFLLLLVISLFKAEVEVFVSKFAVLC